MHVIKQLSSEKVIQIREHIQREFGLRLLRSCQLAETAQIR